MSEESEPLIRLNDVPALPWLPRRRGGKKLNVSTVHRWADPKRPIHLRTTRVGGARCTQENWLREFFDRMAREQPASPAIRSAARRQRDVNHAMTELAQAGII